MSNPSENLKKDPVNKGSKNSFYLYLVLLLIILVIFLVMYGPTYFLKKNQEYKISQEAAVTETTPNNLELDEFLDNIANLATVQMREVEERNDVSLADVHDDVSLGGVNLFGVTYERFKSIQNSSDFESFLNNYSSDFLFAGMIKLSDKDSWMTYWEYLYDYYIKIDDPYIIKDIQSVVQDGEEPKAGFLRYIGEKFSELEVGITTPLTEEELNMDVNVYFNALPLESALANCEAIKDFKDEYSNVNSCRDKIYFYRATRSNKYCEKISDEYKESICNDFLEYQEQ